MTKRDRTVTAGPAQVNLQGNTPMRRDYGPKGCAGIVLAPVLMLAVSAVAKRGGRRG